MGKHISDEIEIVHFLEVLRKLQLSYLRKGMGDLHPIKSIQNDKLGWIELSNVKLTGKDSRLG
jgi:hypothetical protein